MILIYDNVIKGDGKRVVLWINCGPVKCSSVAIWLDRALRTQGDWLSLAFDHDLSEGSVNPTPLRDVLVAVVNREDHCDHYVEHALWIARLLEQCGQTAAAVKVIGFYDAAIRRCS